MSEERHLRFEVQHNKHAHKTVKVKETVPGNCRLTVSESQWDMYIDLSLRIGPMVLKMVQHSTGRNVLLLDKEVQSWQWPERELQCERHWVVVEV